MTLTEVTLRQVLEDLATSRRACVEAMEDKHAYPDVKVAAAGELRRINQTRLEITAQIAALDDEHRADASMFRVL